jgi:hypothetical protein
VFRIRSVMLLKFFVLTSFSLIGIQLYKGALRGICVHVGNNTTSISANDYDKFLNDNGNYNQHLKYV